MKLLLKTLIGLLVVILVGSYLIDTRPVINVLQTGQTTTDPLVAGARTVKQELRTLTDGTHQEVYKATVRQGLKKAASFLNNLADGDRQVHTARPENLNPDNPKSL